MQRLSLSLNVKLSSFTRIASADRSGRRRREGIDESGGDGGGGDGGGDGLDEVELLQAVVVLF